MSDDIRIEGGQQFAQVSRQLKALDKDMGRLLTKAVRQAATPLADAVRTAAAQHSATVARAITLTVAPGAKGGAKVSISAKLSKMPPGHRALPALLEGYAGNPFSHPVWGGTGIAKQAAHPFLVSTITPRLDGAVETIASVVEKAFADAFTSTGGKL